MKVLRQINPLMLRYPDCDWEENVLNIAPHWSLAFMLWPLGFFFTELSANDNCDRVREVFIGGWSGCCWRKETLRSLMEEINKQLLNNTGLFHMFVCGFWIQRISSFCLWVEWMKNKGSLFLNFLGFFCYDVTFL